MTLSMSIKSLCRDIQTYTIIKKDPSNPTPSPHQITDSKTLLKVVRKFIKDK